MVAQALRRRYFLSLTAAQITLKPKEPVHMHRLFVDRSILVYGTGGRSARPSQVTLLLLDLCGLRGWLRYLVGGHLLLDRRLLSRL